LLYIPKELRYKSEEDKYKHTCTVRTNGQEEVQGYFSPFSKESDDDFSIRLNQNSVGVDNIEIKSEEKVDSEEIFKYGRNSIFTKIINNLKGSDSYECVNDSHNGNNIEIKKTRNVLIKYDNGNKYVRNHKGVEFVYYENLEEVRNTLKSKFPGMGKNKMYKELLQPYKHKIFNYFDPVTSCTKQVYQCGYGDCNKKFNKTWNLVDHLRMHEGIKPYRCHL
jgi:hypothetical protein